MSSDRRFVTNPVSLGDRQRSVFNRNFQHKMSLEFGKLNLIGLEEILPGDTFSGDVAHVIRMGTPVAPIMDNINCDLYVFFVPNRLVWDDWKRFNGESDSAWVDTQEYTEPQIFLIDPLEYDDEAFSPTKFFDEYLKNGNANYFDQAGINLWSLIANVYTAHEDGEDIHPISISSLWLKGIQLIYNEFFRDENWIDKVNTFDYSGGNVTLGVTNLGEADFCFLSDDFSEWNQDQPGITTLYTVSKYHDLFTSALPAPQRGDSVLLPLGTEAPILVSMSEDDQVSITDDLLLGLVKNTAAKDENIKVKVHGYEGSGASDTLDSKIYTDLSAATAATVNQLRLAFATQRYLEAMARGGSRYIESLKALFGVNAPNGLLQRPEYLGGKRFRINVDQVLDHSSDLGKTGAYSITTGANSLFTKSFVDHKYVLV